MEKRNLPLFQKDSRKLHICFIVYPFLGFDVQVMFQKRRNQLSAQRLPIVNMHNSWRKSDGASGQHGNVNTKKAQFFAVTFCKNPWNIPKNWAIH